MLLLDPRILLRSFAGAAALSGALLVQHAAAAQPAGAAALPVALEVTSGSCRADDFPRALEARVRRPIERREGAAASLRVVIVEVDGAREGTASFTGASGAATRSVRGSCDEIAAALALVATTWLEAEPAARAASANESEPPSRPVQPAASPPVVVTAFTPSAREGERDPRTTPPRFAIGAQALGTAGLVGGPVGGFGVAVAYRRARLELRGGLRGATGGESVDAGSARYRWVTAPLDGCVHLTTAPTTSLAGCARVEPGLLQTRFIAAESSLPWLVLAAGLRGGWTVGPIRLELEAFATVPATGYRIGTTGSTAVPFRSIAPLVAMGVMVPFS